MFLSIKNQVICPHFLVFLITALPRFTNSNTPQGVLNETAVYRRDTRVPLSGFRDSCTAGTDKTWSQVVFGGQIPQTPHPALIGLDEMQHFFTFLSDITVNNKFRTP